MYLLKNIFYKIIADLMNKIDLDFAIHVDCTECRELLLVQLKKLQTFLKLRK